MGPGPGQGSLSLFCLRPPPSSAAGLPRLISWQGGVVRSAEKRPRQWPNTTADLTLSLSVSLPLSLSLPAASIRDTRDRASFSSSLSTSSTDLSTPERGIIHGVAPLFLAMGKPRPIQVHAVRASGVEGGGGMAGAGGPAAGLLVAAPAGALRRPGPHLPVLVHLRQHALLHPPPPRRRRRRRLPPDRRRVGLGQLSAAPNADWGRRGQQPTAPGPAAALPVGPARLGRGPAAACGLLRAGLLPGPPGPPPGPALRPLPRRPPLLRRHPAADSRVRHAAGEPAPDAGDGGPTGRCLPDGRRVHWPRLPPRLRLRLPAGHGLQQCGGRVAQGLRCLPPAAIHPLHAIVPEPAPPREARQLLPVHAGAGRGGRHPGRAGVGAAAGGARRRRAGHAGVRVPGARGGHHVVDARAVRAPVAELHPLRQPLHPAPVLARRLRLHAPHVVLLQDLRRQLLLPPRSPPPDLVRPTLRLPVLPAGGEEGHQPPDRAGDPPGRQDGRQGAQPRRAQQERGAQRRRHPVREQAPGPARAGGARQHPDGGGDPERDPQQREGGVPHRRHLQARPRHRALPLPQEDQGPDVHHVVGEVPEDPAGGAAGVPAVPRAGHQVPGRTELQDVDRGQVAVAAGAAVGAGGDALPPVRGAPHHRLPPRLHLREAGGDAPPQGRARPQLLRVHHGARRRARLPRRRRRALPRGVGPPRGRRHRRPPHRRRLEGRAQARPRAGVNEDDRSRRRPVFAAHGRAWRSTSSDAKMMDEVYVWRFV